VAHISHSSYVGSINSKISIQTGLGINVRPYLKNNQVVQVVEHLPSKLKALSSNPSKELLNLRGLFMLQRWAAKRRSRFLSDLDASHIPLKSCNSLIWRLEWAVRLVMPSPPACCYSHHRESLDTHNAFPSIVRNKTEKILFARRDTDVWAHLLLAKRVAEVQSDFKEHKVGWN
jgi:hypothetical protein